MSIRIMLTSLITFTLLISVWTYVTEKGYKKVAPKLEQHKKAALENQNMAKQIMMTETQELNSGHENYGRNPNASPLKPEGTYTGILKGAVTKIALAKFQDNRYWILIKDPVSGDTREKGEFDFQVTDLYFQPDDERDYFTDYEQLSPISFRLHGAAGQYIFEKTENVQIDF